MKPSRRVPLLRASMTVLACLLLAAAPSCAARTSAPAGSSSSFSLPKGPLAKLEQSLVFVPLKYPEGNWQLPAGLPVEEANFASLDGTQLHGWFCPHERPRAVVLYCHGNGGNLTYLDDVLRRLHALGASSLVFDYRGYGKSGGSPDESGVLADGRAARAWLAHRAGVAERDLVIMGRSLGGGVAVDLAARDGARGLILESTFVSLPAVAARHSSRPVSWLMRSRLNSLEKIAQYHGPLLVSHGDADELIPFEHGQKLLAAAPGTDKQFVAIRGGGHNGPQSDEYYEALDAFLARLAGPVDAPSAGPPSIDLR